jgi:hypothetical protein
LKLYNTVIEDVIAGVREAFLDEGVDEQVLQELKQIWETKLMSSKAVELNPDPPEPQPPQLNAFKNSSSSKGGSKSKKFVLMPVNYNAFAIILSLVSILYYAPYVLNPTLVFFKIIYKDNCHGIKIFYTSKLI